MKKQNVLGKIVKEMGAKLLSKPVTEHQLHYATSQKSQKA